jgi:hypothetical protein
MCTHAFPCCCAAHTRQNPCHSSPHGTSPIGALDGAHIPRAHDIEDSRRRRGAVEAPVLMTALRPSARPRGCGAGGAA